MLGHSAVRLRTSFLYLLLYLSQVSCRCYEDACTGLEVSFARNTETKSVGNLCFEIHSREKMNFIKASQSCTSHGTGHLAKVDNKIIEDLQTLLTEKEYWIGLRQRPDSNSNSDEDWYWLKRGSEAPATAIDWHKDQPNDYGGKEQDCGALKIKDHKHTIDDKECSIEYPFICQYHRSADNCSYDCADIKKSSPVSGSGVYQIKLFDRCSQKPPDIHCYIDVYCDMLTHGGGWTIFQKRFDGSVNFYRDWTDYENGFGTKDGEYWLGNKIIQHMTNRKRYKLLIELKEVEQSCYLDARYNSFRLADDGNYTLKIGMFEDGVAGDSLKYHQGMPFTTKDRDNDKYSDENCAIKYTGAWWYKGCHYSNLNGVYPTTPGCYQVYPENVNWRSARGSYYSFERAEMKIRHKIYMYDQDDQTTNNWCPPSAKPFCGCNITASESEPLDNSVNFLGRVGFVDEKKTITVRCDGKNVLNTTKTVTSQIKCLEDGFWNSTVSCIRMNFYLFVLKVSLCKK